MSYLDGSCPFCEPPDRRREAAIDELLAWFDLDAVGRALRRFHVDRDARRREVQRELLAKVPRDQIRRWWLR